jgi:hypothetical protein
MCREPALRGLTPLQLAQRLGVSIDEAQRGITRLASALVPSGHASRSLGVSFDEVLGRRARSGPKVAIEYSPDAQGGFATPAAPTLLPPGMTDPRTRSFTSAILDPNLVAQYGEAAVRQLGIAGLVAPPSDLDRVALFTPPPINWPGAYFGWLDRGDGSDPTWADVQNAGSAIGRPDLDALAVKGALAWWRQAYALGPLPEDEQGIDDPRSASWDWPTKGTDNIYRKIYFWGFGKDGRLYQHMQLQKADFLGDFHVFNQYGQNLTFVKQNDGQWIAGWDFGDWFVQNRKAIISAAQLGMTAILACVPFAGAAVAAIASTVFGVTSFGLSLGLTTAISAAVTAQQAFIAGCMAIAKGDAGAAFKYFSDMATALGNVPITGDAKLIPPEFASFMKEPGVQALSKVIGAAGTGDPSALVSKAAELGRTAIQIGKAEIDSARKLVPDHLRPWFDQALKEGGAALGRKAPWYAQGVHTFGIVMGTLQDPQTAGIRAPRTVTPSAPVDLDTMTLAQLEAELVKEQASYDHAAATFYGQTHPALLAILQSNIDKVKQAIAIKKNPAIQAQQIGGAAYQSFLAYRAAHPDYGPQKPGQASIGAAATPAVAGGILALLFFL